ncbi:1-deoxy-D-xylulose-5-phosphate reductoisomerase [Candidatus Halobeggiatoa sp. HSG11]|nr:1-deoxy-D-xylulose-5-phosphate reductoisomerase [Candidatus Halobeggiatoa sp. HSG11]
MKKITILGATGTIGINTLDVIKLYKNDFEVTALTANKNIERLEKLCQEWQPKYAVMADTDAAEQLEQRLKNLPIEVLSGVEGLTKVASLTEVDMVMAGIVGGAGLIPTLAAAQAGKRVLLANKEALVMSGQLFIDAIRQNNAELLPIDSEHNAIFQCLPNSEQAGIQKQGVNKILLTASGGPFRTFSIDQLQNVTPAQACKHPNWSMGQKISVDSATMMNKGLEVIEACWLFNSQPKDIEVVLHPQSIIHSLVEYVDGSLLAQLGNPDMRTPIAYALGWPNRIKSGVKRLSLIDVARLDFEAMDFKRFPCLQLAYDAMQVGGTSTVILNAANEIAVQAFLQEKLKFIEIPKVIETTLSRLTSKDADSLDIILKADTEARQLATELVA